MNQYSPSSSLALLPALLQAAALPSLVKQLLLLSSSCSFASPFALLLSHTCTAPTQSATVNVSPIQSQAEVLSVPQVLFTILSKSLCVASSGFSNASLHWVSKHVQVVLRFVVLYCVLLSPKQSFTNFVLCFV